MKQLYTKDGVLIVGTLEKIPARATVNGWVQGSDGKLEPVYAGETEPYWDDQKTVTNDVGIMIVVDEEGIEYLASECELKDDGEPDEA